MTSADSALALGRPRSVQGHFPPWLAVFYPETLDQPEARTIPPSRIFDGQASEVRAVRDFVREELEGHPALDDAVMVASELAANAAEHTRSGKPGGSFIVRLAAAGGDRVSVLVIDQGAPTEPIPVYGDFADEDCRGLRVVAELAETVKVLGDKTGRGVLAVLAPQRAGGRG